MRIDFCHKAFFKRSARTYSDILKEENDLIVFREQTILKKQSNIF